ncbi:MAG TPA: peptidylprolyl isomerase [Nannocystis sp.]|jgi:peptidyl-prolyl cis-trans isomerase SurA
MLRSLALSLSVLLACAAEAPKPEAAQAEPAKPEPVEAEPEKPAKPAPDAKEACAKIVVVAWAGAEGAEATVTRDEAAAKTTAEALREKLVGGAAFAEVAAQSDEPKTRAKGGAMGTFERDKWPEKYAAIADAVFGLQVGETSPAIRTPLGHVVAQRCAVEKIHSRHILVRYKGAKNAEASIKRDAKAARALAEKVHAEATAAGADFAVIARKYSEDGSADRGGDLGSVGRGMFAPAFETAAFALKPGETSAVVETDFGFHVIQRVE